MARAGITYDEVVAAIDEIIANGENPTIMRVREVLGTGSPNTIHRHLTAWRETATPAERRTPEIPYELLTAIEETIEREAAEQRAEVEKQLVDCKQESQELSKSGEELEAVNANLEEGNALLSSEKERLAALAEERQGEVERLQSELERERQAAEEARILVAQERNKIELQEVKIVELTATATELTATTKAAENAQVAAEKLAAVLEAKLEAEARSASDLRERLNVVQEQLKADAEKHKDKVDDVNAGLVDALKKITELERDIAEQQRDNMRLTAKLEVINEQKNGKISRKN